MNLRTSIFIKNMSRKMFLVPFGRQIERSERSEAFPIAQHTHSVPLF